MIVVIGEAPSQSSDPRRPFDGYSGKKLAEYAGMSGYDELAACCRLANILHRWPGVGHAGEKGSRFPLPRARRAAKRFRFERFDKVILAGTRVAAAFGIQFIDPFSWKLLPRGDLIGAPGRTRELVWFAMIPHPSGCNRFYNDPANRRRAAVFLQREVFGGSGRVLAEGMCSATE